MERMEYTFTPADGQSKEGTNQETVIIEGTVNGEDALITIHPFALPQETVDVMVEYEGFDYDEETDIIIGVDD
jgi:hypothetical protein